MIAVGDHINVGRYPVEDRHVVRRERTDAAVATLAKVLARAFEARHELPHRRRQVIGEFGLGLVFVVIVTIRIGHRIRSDLDRNRAALHTGPVHPFGAVLPVDIRVIGELASGALVDDRGIHQLDMQHRRVKVARGTVRLVDIHLAFQEPPIGPHILAHRRAVGIARLDLVRFSQHRPMLRCPCAQAEHDSVAADIAAIRAHFRHAATRRVVAHDLHAGQHTHAMILALLGETRDRLTRAGIAAHLFVQHNVDAVGLEVGPDFFQEVFRVHALVEVGGITDPRLARVQLFVIRSLIRFTCRHVADLLKAEGHRIVGPDINRMPQDRVYRLGHV